MPQVVMFDREPFSAASASVRDGELWLSRDELPLAVGWDVEPEGFCRGDVCMPVPPARRGELLGETGAVNVSAFARLLGRAAVHDETHGVWAFAQAAGRAEDPLRATLAPDFRLPDLDGTVHALSDHRGSKVLLLSWASW